MSKRKAPEAGNPNQDFCDFLFELANFEKNVSRNIYRFRCKYCTKSFAYDSFLHVHIISYYLFPALYESF